MRRRWRLKARGRASSALTAVALASIGCSRRLRSASTRSSPSAGACRSSPVRGDHTRPERVTATPPNPSPIPSSVSSTQVSASHFPASTGRSGVAANMVSTGVRRRSARISGDQLAGRRGFACPEHPAAVGAGAVESAARPRRDRRPLRRATSRRARRRSRALVTDRRGAVSHARRAGVRHGCVGTG